MHGIIFLGVLMQLVKLKSINYDTITVSQDRLNIVNKERVKPFALERSIFTTVNTVSFRNLFS